MELFLSIYYRFDYNSQSFPKYPTYTHKFMTLRQSCNSLIASEAALENVGK